MNSASRVEAPKESAQPKIKLSEIQSTRVQLCALIFFVDCFAILIGCLLGNLLRFGDTFAPAGINLFAVVLPIFAGIAVNSDAYAAEVLADARTGFSRAAMAFAFAVFAVIFLAFYMKASSDLSRLTSTVAIASTLTTLAIGRWATGFYVKKRTGLQLVYDLLILDGISLPVPAGVHALDAERDDLRPDMSNPQMLNRLAMHLRGVDRVVIACPPERRDIWAMLLKGSSVNGHILADELDAIGAIGIGMFWGKHTVAVAHAPLDLSRRLAKRTFDLALTIPIVIFLSPLLIATAIAIKLDSRGPIFFVQPRVGRGNRIFRMFKFRSMRDDAADSAGALSTRRDDDRITRVGRVIRASSLDELPQLLNVLRGEMSLVGPRPHALGSLAGTELFWEVDQRYWHRHASKPGLTGLAQIRGYRGATREREDLSNRLRADLEYLNGWSIWRDISILVTTLKVVFHRNAY